MASLEQKIEHALNEDHILVLGGHVLLGLQLRSVFETGFSELPESSRNVEIVGLLLTVVAIAVLMLPASYHRIAGRGEISADLHAATSVALEIALLPLAVGLGTGVYVATEKLAGPSAGILAGVVTTGLALSMWYGFELVQVQRRRAHGQPTGGGLQAAWCWPRREDGEAA